MELKEKICRVICKENLVASDMFSELAVNKYIDEHWKECSVDAETSMKVIADDIDELASLAVEGTVKKVLTTYANQLRKGND